MYVEIDVELALTHQTKLFSLFFHVFVLKEKFHLVIFGAIKTHEVKWKKKLWTDVIGGKYGFNTILTFPCKKTLLMNPIIEGGMIDCVGN